MVNVKKLSCGATLVCEKTDYVRSAALGIWVKSGSAYETEDISGVSHYIEHMMFKGTSIRTAKEIAEAVDCIGGQFNAFTGKEATCYYIKTLSSNIYKGAEILLNMVTDSLFDEEEMLKEKQVILEEIKMVNDTPDDLVYDIIAELVNSENPLGNSILGTPKTLGRIGRKELVEYYRKRYSRENIVIAVAGNFDEEKIYSIFEEGLLGLEEKTEENKPVLKPYKTSFNVKVKDIEQTHICLATPGVSMDDERYYSFVLMNSIFGGSMSSRLFQKIREEKGLAYSVASMNAFNSYAGFFNIYAGIAHDKIEETITAIGEELKLLKTKGVSKDELSMAKEQVKSSYIFGLENINSRMFSLGKNQLLLNKTYDPDLILEGFDGVTQDDILEAASIIGKSDQYCGASVSGVNFDLEGLIKNAN